MTVNIREFGNLRFSDQHFKGLEVMAKKALTKMKRTEAMAELSCEWTDCNQVFYDLTLYLQHIHKSHINEYNPGFDDETDRSYSCQWIGCEENRFDNYSQFCLHVSYHGFHQKLMSNGTRDNEDIRFVVIHRNLSNDFIVQEIRLTALWTVLDAMYCLNYRMSLSVVGKSVSQTSQTANRFTDTSRDMHSKTSPFRRFQRKNSRELDSQSVFG